jgi:hypothetical protein
MDTAWRPRYSPSIWTGAGVRISNRFTRRTRTPHPSSRHVQHVPSVSQRVRSFEQNHLEMIVVERGATGDFEIAAVIPHAADQRETAPVNCAVHPHLELFHASKKSWESSGPVGQLADGVLKARAHLVHDVGIQARSGHEQKIARAETAGDPAESHRTGFERNQPLGGRLQSRAQAELHRQDVSGAAR